MVTNKREALRTRDPERTRLRILAVATRLFARSGYHGTSVNEVVAAAHVNKRMVYHYFGDKDGLYREVLAAQWTEMKGVLASALASTSGGATASPHTAVLGAYFDFVASHPEYVRLLMWEGLEGRETARELSTSLRGPMFEQLRRITRSAQREGRLARTLDPAHLVVSLLGAVLFSFAFAGKLNDLMGADPLSPGKIARRRRQIIALLEGLGPASRA